MILRLFRARVVPGHEADIAAFIRDRAIPGVLEIEGLRSFQPGVRADADGHELVLVSTWRDFGDIVQLGPATGTPLTAPDAGAMLRRGSAEHFELVWGDSRALPLREGVLRVTRLPILPRYEALYFTELREAADHLIDRAGLNALAVGRQAAGRNVVAIVVTVWEDRESLEQAIEPVGDQRMLFAPLARYHAGPMAAEEFDALTAVVPSPDAPAILIADDEGHYIHATPAAERLTGRSLARLRTLRVQDIAGSEVRAAVPQLWSDFVGAGSSTGAFVITRPDGSEARVVYQARTATPWPGTHSSLLIPENEPAELDIDAALARSGLVARYAAVG